MSLKLVLLSCIVALSSAKRLPRLAGGEDAKPGQYPYQVNLYYKSTLNSEFPIAFGGGAILNKQWILTAAYNRQQSYEDVVVKAGNIYLAKPLKSEQVSNVLAMFVHPKYDDPTGPYDIALIKLETPLKFDEFVRPIDLPQAGSHPHGSGVLTGLGSLSHIMNPVMAPTLQTLTLPIISRGECRNLIYAALGDIADEIDFFGDDLAFCTGPTQKNLGYCLHDTGNPLVTEENGKKVVAGVASFGFAADCTTPNAPSIYTRVSAFNDWIKKIISEN